MDLTLNMPTQVCGMAPFLKDTPQVHSLVHSLVLAQASGLRNPMRE